jgi:biotin carboxylase
MIPHVLLLGAWEELAAKLIGLPITVSLLQNPGGVSPLQRAVVGRVVEVDYTDRDTALAAAAAVHAVHPISAVLSMRELGLEAAAYVAECLGVPGMDPGAVRATRDKALMRRTLRAAGVDGLPFAVCSTPSELADFAASVNGEVIVKPIAGAGSAGVAHVAARLDTTRAFEHAAAAGQGTSLLAERRLHGREFSVESVSAQGRHVLLAITAKTTTGPPHFIELGHELPARLDAAAESAIRTKVIATLDALGHTVGACHTEVILERGDPCVVEVNTRPGGDRIWELVELATGLDLVTCSLRALLDNELPSEPAPRAGAAIHFLTASQPGLLHEVSGVAAASAHPGVIRVGGLATGPTYVTEPTSSAERLGYVLTVGATARQAGRRAADALRCLNAEIFDPAAAPPASRRAL